MLEIEMTYEDAATRKITVAAPILIAGARSAGCVLPTGGSGASTRGCCTRHR